VVTFSIVRCRGCTEAIQSHV